MYHVHVIPQVEYDCMPYFQKTCNMQKTTFRACTIAYSHAGIVRRDQTSTLFVLDYLTLKFKKFDTYKKLL